MYQIQKLTQCVRDSEIARIKRELKDLEVIVNELQDIFVPEDEHRMHLCMQIINSNTYLLNELLTDKPYYLLKLGINDLAGISAITEKLSKLDGGQGALIRLKQDISSKLEHTKAGFSEQETACILLSAVCANKLSVHKACCIIG